MKMRTLLLSAALCILAGSGALLAAVPELQAAAGGCSVNCANGTSCSADPSTGQSCTCTCALYGTGAATCTCAELRPNTSG